VGAGRTELGRAIYGEFACRSGTVNLYGKRVKINSSGKALQLGIAYATEDRKYDGILYGRSLKENICLSSLKKYTNPLKLISRKAETLAVDRQIKALGIKTWGYAQEIQTLSGGNQQKACLSKWLLVNPKILIFDEPTRGIDVGAKAEFYQIICDLADRGTSIILISSEESELIGLCDRIAVLREGRKVKEMVPHPGCLSELSHYMFGLEC
jgi:ABC-type sugar transport system ATPase subunit